MPDGHASYYWGFGSEGFFDITSPPVDWLRNCDRRSRFAAVCSQYIAPRICSLFCASYGHKAALPLAKPSSPTVPGQVAQQPILQTIEDQAEEQPELDEGLQEGDTANQQPDESSAPAGFTLGEDSIDWQELST